METHSSNIVTKRLGLFIKRFHLLIFFILVAGCLAAGVILVNQTSENTASDENYTSPISAGAIDRDTLNHIQSLHTSNAAQTPQPQSGRINPFAE